MIPWFWITCISKYRTMLFVVHKQLHLVKFTFEKIRLGIILYVVLCFPVEVIVECHSDEGDVSHASDMSFFTFEFSSFHFSIKRFFIPEFEMFNFRKTRLYWNFTAQVPFLCRLKRRHIGITFVNVGGVGGGGQISFSRA